MDYNVEAVSLQGGPAIAIRETCRMEDLPQFLTDAFTELDAYARDAGARETAPRLARYLAVLPEAFDVEAVIPVDTPVAGSGRIHPVELEGGPAVQVLYVGPYEGLGQVYQAVEEWVREHQLAAIAPVREVYLTGPETPPAEHRTLVVQPIAES